MTISQQSEFQVKFFRDQFANTCTYIYMKTEADESFGERLKIVQTSHGEP